MRRFTGRCGLQLQSCHAYPELQHGARDADHHHCTTEGFPNAIRVCSSVSSAIRSLAAAINHVAREGVANRIREQDASKFLLGGDGANLLADGLRRGARSATTGTPTGTYTIMVTGMAGPIQSTTKVTLTVQ